MNTALLELFQIGVTKNYEFHFKVSEEKLNFLSVIEDEKIIDVTIGDPDHEDLPSIIEDIKTQLK